MSSALNINDQILFEIKRIWQSKRDQMIYTCPANSKWIKFHMKIQVRRKLLRILFRYEYHYLLIET